MKISFKKLFKITAKNKIKPEFTKLYVKNGFAYATDSFRAVKMKTMYPADKEGYITKIAAIVAEEKSKDIGLDIKPELEKLDIEYLDIDAVIPQSKSYIKLRLNRKYLIEVLEALQKGNKFDSCILKICLGEEKKPIVIENDNGIGILMPMGK